MTKKQEKVTPVASGRLSSPGLESGVIWVSPSGSVHWLLSQGKEAEPAIFSRGRLEALLINGTFVVLPILPNSDPYWFDWSKYSYNLP